MATVEAKLPGAPLSKVDKRAAEVITYLIDCTSLLDTHELVVSAKANDLPAGVTIENLRTRKGMFVEATVSNQPISTAAYIDFTINLTLKTSFNNTRLAVFILRVYK